MSSAVEARIDACLHLRKDPACLRIGVAGGSGSGKSAVCDVLRQGLLPCVTEVIALDKFFKPVDQLPKYYSSYHQGCQPDFNTPDSLMVERMVTSCRAVAAPGVVIFDGHFALYYAEMRELMDIKCFVAVDVAEMLERRTKRNLAAGYGGDRENILAYNRECVVPRYAQFIQPTQSFADVVIRNGRSDMHERDALLDMLCRKIRAQQTGMGRAQAGSSIARTA
jgi:uridine kinase